MRMERRKWMRSVERCVERVDGDEDSGCLKRAEMDNSSSGT